MKMGRPISPILTLKLVAMATSLERSGQEGQSVIYDQIPTCSENLVKISPVDPEIALLKGSFKNE